MRKAIFVLSACMVFLSPLYSEEKIIIAVLDFEARDVAKSEGKKVSEIIRNELTNSNRFKILERSEITRILKAQDLDAGGCGDISCATRTGQEAGAHKVLIGSVMNTGGNLTITGRIIDVKKGSVEFTEKERAVYKDDELYMVERFCDNVARRLTGNPLYAVKAKKPPIDKDTDSLSYYETYNPAADPTGWLALGTGIVSGIGFLYSYSSYDMMIVDNNFDRDTSLLLWAIGADPIFPDPALQIISLIEYKKSMQNKHDAARERDNSYYAAAGIGGFTVLMLTLFIGRNIASAVSENKAAKAGDISIVIPPTSITGITHTTRNNLRVDMGLAVRF